MPRVCFYFQVHQPKRLRKYSFFDIGHVHHYEDEDKNCEILLKVSNKCYLPSNRLLLKLIQEYGEEFKVAFSLSGCVIEQFKRFSPETLDSFKALSDTGCVEILNETYHHSLSATLSKALFFEEVDLHRNLIQKEFGQQSNTFRNTELIYNNDLASWVESLGYKAILAEGADKILQGRSPNYLYQPLGCSKLKLLLRNYALSDDIAFRFGNRAWQEHPLTAHKFSHWIHALKDNADVINLFMDYETFGEHQWDDTGIFSFLKSLPMEILKHPDFGFCTPSEAALQLPAISALDIPHFYSWADTERDLTAWRGNHLQEDALQTIISLEEKIKSLNNLELKQKFLSFLTSDHFYYMCTKWNSDGDVHKYFNPYNNPYEAYINFQNIIKDFHFVIEDLSK